MKQSIFCLMISEIQRQYTCRRMHGESRASAIHHIRDSYWQELIDDEDCLSVVVGLVLALCTKNELEQTVACDALKQISLARKRKTVTTEMEIYLVKVEQCIADPNMYGGEAHYIPKTPYKPEWEIGDVFMHTLTHPDAKELGIYGWSIIMVKIGEHIDTEENYRQLMCLSICEPGKEPNCGKDIERIGFLPVMHHGAKVEYLAQITLKNKRQERSYELRKIGHFIDVVAPKSIAFENPLTAMPLFGRIRKCDEWMGYEDQICRIFRKLSR